jgi:hypothetical protein
LRDAHLLCRATLLPSDQNGRLAATIEVEKDEEAHCYERCGGRLAGGRLAGRGAGDGGRRRQHHRPVRRASQLQVAVGIQNGDQNAATNDGSTAEASNELGITQNQANAGLGEIDDLNQGDDSVGDVLIFY